MQQILSFFWLACQIHWVWHRRLWRWRGGFENDSHWTKCSQWESLGWLSNSWNVNLNGILISWLSRSNCKPIYYLIPSVSHSHIIRLHTGLLTPFSTYSVRFNHFTHNSPLFHAAFVLLLSLSTLHIITHYYITISIYFYSPYPFEFWTHQHTHFLIFLSHSLPNAYFTVVFTLPLPCLRLVNWILIILTIRCERKGQKKPGHWDWEAGSY